jgi:hypothetical protein
MTDVYGGGVNVNMFSYARARVMKGGFSLRSR